MSPWWATRLVPTLDIWWMQEWLSFRSSEAHRLLLLNQILFLLWQMIHPIRAMSYFMAFHLWIAREEPASQSQPTRPSITTQILINSCSTPRPGNSASSHSQTIALCSIWLSNASYREPTAITNAKPAALPTSLWILSAATAIILAWLVMFPTLWVSAILAMLRREY